MNPIPSVYPLAQSYGPIFGENEGQNLYANSKKIDCFPGNTTQYT